MESSKPPNGPVGHEGSHSLGRYQIQGELGRGAMGAVYQAFDPVIARTVALKTILIDERAADRTQLVERLKQEAKAAGGLDHPNIITIYDVGEGNGSVYLSMQFVKGTTLASLLADVGVPSLPTLLSWADQILAAVGFAHARGVIHRDLKPANIMVTEQGVIKVLDFGIAKIDNTHLTQTGLAIGTPGYMSPEQIAGRKVDHRADIFSLGAVFYELLTRERAFAGDIATVLYKIVNEDPVAPSLINPAIPGGIDAVIRKALAKDPKNRFQTCEEMRKTLLDKSSRLPLAAPAAISPEKGVGTRPAALVGTRHSRPPEARPRLWPRLILGAVLVLVGMAARAFFVRSRTGAFPPSVAKLENKATPTRISGSGKLSDRPTQVSGRTEVSGVAPSPTETPETATASANAIQKAAAPASATTTSPSPASIATLRAVTAQSSSDHSAIQNAPISRTLASPHPVEASPESADPSPTASTQAAEPSDGDQTAAKNATVSRTEHSALSADDREAGWSAADKPIGQERFQKSPETVDGYSRDDVPDLLRRANFHATRGNYFLARYEYRLVLKLAPSNVEAQDGLRTLQNRWKSR